MPNKKIAAGKYEIEREIGAGGMGTVFVGRDTQFRDPVAIKLMKVDPANNIDDTIKSFMDEARSYRKLAHPYIVKYFDFVREKVRGKPDELYIVTEFIKGKSLDNILNEMRSMGLFFDEGRARIIAIKLLEALKYSHSEGVIHRDLKPSNVMFDESDDPQTKLPRVDEPRLIDFGIAKQGGSGSKTIGLAAIAFSPHYSSPEQAVGSDLTTQASDIYSMGVLLYDMLTGRVHSDFPQRPGTRILIGTIDDVPQKIMSANISQHMKTVILKATDPHSNNRYTSAEEMIVALSGGVVVHSPPKSSPGGKPFVNFTTTKRPTPGIKPKD